MTETADVVIIGGGIVGTSVAYHLAKRGAGHGVILLERETLGSGTTASAGGGIRSQFSTELNIRFSIESVAFWKRFEDELGLPVDYRECGYLFLAQTEEQRAQFERNVALQNRLGVPSRLLTPAQAGDIAHGMRIDDLVAASWHAHDGKAGPADATAAFARRAREGGVRIREGVEVRAIDTAGGRVRAVETSDGRIETPVVLNAAGPWAGPVGRLADVDVPVTPYNRATFVSEPFAELPADLPMIIDLHVGLSMHREGGGLQLSGRRAAQPGFDRYVDWDSIERSATLAVHRLPVVEHARFGKKAWAGLYDTSPDDHAILGEAPGVRGFHVACGFSGHGFQHAPATGRLLSELILDGRTTGIDIGPLGLDRFRTGALLHEPLTVHARAATA